MSVGPWYVPQQRQPRGVPGNTREAVGLARMVLSGLLPACKAAGELGEWEQKKLEAAVARAVVSAQEVVVVILLEYKESTRKARAAKHAERARCLVERG